MRRKTWNILAFWTTHGKNLQFIHKSRQQRQDIPFKIVTLNCQAVKEKKISLSNLCSGTGADIVIGTESWLNSSHLDSEIFPENFNVYRRDRILKEGDGPGGGVFILVDKKYQSLEPAELSIDADREMLWVQVTVREARNL